MGRENSKKVLIALIAILVIIVIVFVFMVASKSKQQLPQTTTPVITPIIEEDQQIETGDGAIITPLTEEEKKEIASIKNVTGKVVSIEAGNIKITTTEGELSLKIPQEGASFITQTLQESGAFMVEDIDPLSISQDKEVDIQYSGLNNEVMLVVVK